MNTAISTPLKSQARSREYLSDAALLGVSVIWGSTFIIIKQAIVDIPTFAFLSLRFFVAGMLLLAVCHRRLSGLNLEIIKDGLILGTFLFLTFAFQTLGLRYTPASVTAFISGLYIVFVPVFSALWLRKAPTRYSVLGVLISVAGLGLITLNGRLGLSLGEFYVLINAVTCSIHIILIDHYSRKHDLFLLTTIQIWVIFLLSLGLSLGFEPFTLPGVWSSQLVTAVVLTGVFATVVAFLVQTGLQKHTTPTKAALIYSMEPVSSIFFGYLIAGELLVFKQYLGAFLIIVAMLVAELGTCLRKPADN